MVLYLPANSCSHGKTMRLQGREWKQARTLKSYTQYPQLQSFGHLMRKTDSFEKTVMLGKIEGGRRRG